MKPNKRTKGETIIKFITFLKFIVDRYSTNINARIINKKSLLPVKSESNIPKTRSIAGPENLCL